MEEKEFEVYNLAKRLHIDYERFAVLNGWKTQPSTQVSFDDLPEANKKTMLDLANSILEDYQWI